MRSKVLPLLAILCVVAFLPTAYKLYLNVKHVSFQRIVHQGLTIFPVPEVIPLHKISRNDLFDLKLKKECNMDAFLLLNCEDGFNNQVICLMDALAFGNTLDRTVVLPTVNVFRANNPLVQDEIGENDFSRYFDVQTWRQHGLCAISRTDFFEIRKQKLGRDDKPVINFGYRLNHTDARFTPHYHKDMQEAFNRHFDVTDKTYLINSTSYSTDKSILKSFGGKTSTLPNELDLLFIPLMYQEYDFMNNRNYFISMYNVLFKSLKTNLVREAERFIANKEKGLGGEKYISIHIRRGDWWMDQCIREQKLNSIERCYPSVSHIERVMKNLLAVTGAKFVFILTNDATELLPLKEVLPIRMYGDMGRMFTGQTTEVFTDPTEQLIVDMLIAAKSQYFVGNLWSTFSLFIYHQRLLLKQELATTLWW